METIKLETPAIVEPVPTTPPQMTPDSKNVLPTTTAAEDLRTQGQRRVNLIWETTQAVVAVMVTAATIYSAVSGRESLVLGNAFTLIIALYFVRQNHSRTGGIGGDSVNSSR